MAVFQCSLSLGTSVREVTAVYVMCECLQNRECVETDRKRERERGKKWVRAVNTSKVTSSSLHGSAQLELLKSSVITKASTPVSACMCKDEFMFILMGTMYMRHMHVWESLY